MELNMNRISSPISKFLLIINLVLCAEKVLSKTSTLSVETTTEQAETSTSQTDFSTDAFTTTCKVNSSCKVSTTAQDLVTTALPPEHGANETFTSAPMLSSAANHTKKNRETSTRSAKDLCICDLMVDYCDINCCCDRDCTQQNKFVFGHCEPDFHHYDTRTCQYNKYMYINKTRHEFQINQDGLFCIAKNNLPQSYLIQRKNPLKNLEEAEFEKKYKYSWPIRELENVTIFPMSNYTYGEQIWILRNRHLENFQLPKNFVVTNCLVKDNIKYLIDSKSSCSQTDISEENSALKADNYFRNLSIIAEPYLFNETFYKKSNISKECPKNICIPATTKVCKQHFEECIPVAQNTTALKQSCRLSISNNKVFCVNLVKRVKYNLYHNGTHGIYKVDVFIILYNMSYTLGKDVDLLQTFEVNFIWWNTTLNISSYLSGNPGYLIGKPILIANAVPVNVTSNSSSNSTNATSSNVELQLQRDPLDFRTNFMVLPFVNTDGQCVLNKHEYTPIEFGYNLYLKCTVNERVLNRNMTARKICIKIQETILKYWSMDSSTNKTLSNLMIGQFGNANMYNNDEWVNAMFRDDVEHVLNRTWGEYDNRTNSVNCRNISTLLILDIYHTRVDFEEVLNQEKILAATFQFSNLRNFSFSVGAKQAYFNLESKISMQVAFFDITTKKIRKIVDPPSLNIRLPHDFFYPFVKLDNSAAKLALRNSILFAFFCIIFIIL